jgi:chemotaxis protein CheC
MNGIELTSQERSFMDRLGRLGGRMGATALSHILGCKVNIKVSEIFFIPLEDIQYLLGDPGIVVTGIQHEFVNELEGYLLTLIPVELAKHHLSHLLKKEVDEDYMASSQGLSGLGELSNILCGSYISAIGNMLDIVIIPFVPLVKIDMMGAITQDIILRLKPETVQAMIIKTELIIAGDLISLHLLMLLEQESFKFLNDRIRLKTGVQENGNFRQDKQD